MRFELETGAQGVKLVAFEQNDNRWHILTFRKDGRVVRATGVPPDIGFQVDERGRVIVRGR